MTDKINLFDPAEFVKYHDSKCDLAVCSKTGRIGSLVAIIEGKGVIIPRADLERLLGAGGMEQCDEFAKGYFKDGKRRAGK